MKVKLVDVRLAFPDLFVAKAFAGSDEASAPSFGATFLFPPEHKAHKLMIDAINAAGIEKWAGKSADILRKLLATDKTCLRDGDNKSEYDGFSGMMYVSSRNKTRPQVRGKDAGLIDAKDGIIYGGCYVDAVIEIWAQDNQYGKRVNASLKGVQFRRDGDAFAGGAPLSDDDFEDLTEQGTVDESLI